MKSLRWMRTGTLPATTPIRSPVNLLSWMLMAASRESGALRTAHTLASLLSENSLLATAVLRPDAANRIPIRSPRNWLRSSSVSLAFSATSTATSQDSMRERARWKWAARTRMAAAGQWLMLMPSIEVSGPEMSSTGPEASPCASICTPAACPIKRTPRPFTNAGRAVSTRTCGTSIEMVVG